MPSYNDVFKRVEKKYHVDCSQRALLEHDLAPFMEPDAYGRTTITSVYLDTPERSLIAHSLEKPLYKEKLRVRTYGQRAGELLIEAAYLAHDRVPLSKLCAQTCSDVRNRMTTTPVFFELKKKFKGVVYKRRVGLTLAALLMWLEGAPYTKAVGLFPLVDAVAQMVSTSARSCQIARELEVTRSRYKGLRPSMVIACERVAWVPCATFAEELGSLRVTFDGALDFVDLDGEASADRVSAGQALADRASTGQDSAGQASAGLCMQPIIDHSESIVEIKSTGPYPLWLVHSLSDNRIKPCSFSKYGTAAILVHQAKRHPTDLAYELGERYA